jgi:hypothetical protein
VKKQLTRIRGLVGGGRIEVVEGIVGWILYRINCLLFDVGIETGIEFLVMLFCVLLCSCF